MGDERIINAVMEMHKTKQEYFENRIDVATAKNRIKLLAQIKGVDPKITMQVLRDLDN
jgi:hypothetical protein